MKFERKPAEPPKPRANPNAERDKEARQEIEKHAKEFAEKAAKQRAIVGTQIRFPGDSAPPLDGLKLPAGVKVELNQDGTVDIEATPGKHPEAAEN